MITKNKERKFETALFEKSKTLCEECLSTLHDPNRKDGDIIHWEEVCKTMEYPFDSAFDSEGNMTEHFRRTISELKICRIWGNHTFHFYNDLSNRYKL